MFDALYRGSRTRIGDLARSLTDDQLASIVPASPEWTSHQVVAHVVGVAADLAAGNVAGAPEPPWTAAQVAAREGRSIAELLDEWDRVGPVVEAGLADRTYSVIPVFDLMTHECDLREHLRLGTPPAIDVRGVLRTAAKVTVGRYSGPDVLVVRAGDDHWSSGEGDRRVELDVEPYELFRGLFSRRSRQQMRSWQWSGDADADAMVDRLPVFGPRDDDQPIPATTASDRP